jgi:prepilin-type N-terminal cleavage/methylation domain-containing protein
MVSGRRRRQRGYSLMEIVVAMSIFLMFLATVFVLTAEMRDYERRLPVNFQKHPQVASVLSRLRRDVLDAHGKNPYRDQHDGFVASGKVLIVESVQADGSVQTIVWDFREPGVARRRAYSVGNATDWWARGLPEDFSKLEIDAIRTSSDAAWATRIIAKDRGGRIAIDQIFQPRATE